MSTSINTPSLVQVPYGGGSPGAICATGTAQQRNGENPTEVWGKIIALTGGVPALDKTTSVQGAFLSGLHWRISKHDTADIPNAVCSASGPAATNRLAVWTVYPTGNPDADTVTFDGVCSNHTDCDFSFPLQSTLAAIPAEAPPKMQVSAHGFTAPKTEGFNGVFTLHASRKSRCLWEHGARGKNVVRLELRLQLEEPTLWELVFKCGRTKVLYLQSNLNWHWTRANDMLYSGGDARKKGVAPTVRVAALG